MKSKRASCVPVPFSPLTLASLLCPRAGKHKHKKRVSEKKKARHEQRKLRRAEKRCGRQRTPGLHDGQRDDEAVHDGAQLEDSTQDQVRRRVRESRQSSQRKARDMTLSRFRQIVLSDASGDEDASHDVSSQETVVQRDDMKIPSTVARSLRKKVNKLSHAFDSSLTFADEDASPTK